MLKRLWEIITGHRCPFDGEVYKFARHVFGFNWFGMVCGWDLFVCPRCGRRVNR